MTASWKSDYLLNLVLVARADGVLQPIEVLWLSRCRRGLEAGNADLADAVMRSYWEEHAASIALVTDERVLRDMVQMAVMDGCSDAREQDLVFRFIDLARIPAERAGAVIREALAAAATVREQVRIEVGSRGWDALRPGAG